MSELERIDPRFFGQRLAEFRKACGKTQEELAKHLSMSRPTYIAIEKGSRRATPDEIVRLAALLGRSVHELVRPTAPAVELAPHLRAAVDQTGTGDAEVYEAIEGLARFAADYRDLEQLVGAKPVENYPAEIRVPAGKIADFAEDMASRERSRLRLGDGPVLQLRQLLENNVGIRVFYVAVASSIAGMYAFVAELGYCILINSKHPRERQRWTLAHEYGHFLADRHKPGVDYTRHVERVPAGERFADSFATCFLMPAAGLRQQYFDIVGSRGDFQVADICSLANYYVVSVQAMTLRLESLGLVRKGTWDTLAEQGLKPETAKRSLKLEPRESAKTEAYPARYKFLAVLAFCEEKLTEGELADYLRTDRVSARKIVRECMNRSDDVGSDGHDAILQLSLEHSLVAS